MNRRERILVVAIVSIGAAAVLYGLIDRLILAGGRKLSERADALRESNSKLESKNHRLIQCRSRFVRMRDLTFDDNPRRASVLADARIKQLARQAGLGQADYTVSSFSERREGNAYRELLCTITGATSLERLTNFLYLLKRDSHLHRITHLSLKPQSGGGGGTPAPRRSSGSSRARRWKARPTAPRGVSFSLRYSTLVLDGKAPVKVPPRTPATQPIELAGLNTPQRATYDVIAGRNIFKPYVRPTGWTRPPRQTQPRRHPDTQPAPQTPQYDRLVVTGLPAYGDREEVHVTMPGRDIEKVLKVGDRLPIGVIAMVDYRVLPMPGKPHLISPSRVILKIGQDYWAVELGQRLGQRRILRARELPDELKKGQPAGRPATRPTTQWAGVRDDKQ